ncbi:Retrovirus-related Pol polyprotein from transposon TNT 1-94-like protein [Drosera capensis]
MAKKKLLSVPESENLVEAPTDVLQTAPHDVQLRRSARDQKSSSRYPPDQYATMTDAGLTSSLDLEIEQMNVKTTFLHGDLQQKIYIKQTKGFVIKGKEDYGCRLRKNLYGLKHTPRQWYKKF